MDNTGQKYRSWILVALALLIFAAFTLQLMQIQIVDAEKYRELVQGRTVSTQPIKAVRGEIVDRNGIPLVQNETSYDVVFDRAFLPLDQQADVILRVIDIFQENHVPWTDDFPITTAQPFEYIKGMEKEVEELKKAKKGQVYTKAGDMMSWLVKEYKLADYSLEDARKIVAVYYQMEQKDFSMRTPYVFAKDVPNAMVIQIKENGFNLPGVNVGTSATRVYPKGDLAPHIIGLTGPLYKEEYDLLSEGGLIYNPKTEVYDTKGYTLDDSIGKSGIEKAMEDYLRGDNGLKEIQVDANGNVIDSVESISPIPGQQVVLTIDSEMQEKAQLYLESQIKYLAETQPKGRGAEANSGAVVVVNVKTGEVLAAATYPSYSISDYKENYSQVEKREGRPLINRAILGEYTPGSIYKPVVSLAGLNSGAITPHTVFNCTYVYNRFAPSYTPKCLSSHGNISLYNAIGWSCNIFFYETGFYTGIDKIDQMAKMLGLGEYTGVEIQEAMGQRSNPEVKAKRTEDPWMDADTIQTAIGQFDSRFSPLQMANYAATIANKGTRMKLTLIKEIKSYNGDEVIVPFKPEVAFEMSEVAPEAFDNTIIGMVNATTGSSGGTFGGYPISVASKTGTPQVTEDIVNSTFICYAPVEDPEIAIAVVIEQGWQGYTGAPVAKAIFDDYFGIDHRGAVDSGPKRLKDLWAAEKAAKQGDDFTATTPTSYTPAIDQGQVPQEQQRADLPPIETDETTIPVEDEQDNTGERDIVDDNQQNSSG